MGFAPETIVFLYACALGAGLGVLYDLFRLMRLVTGGKAALVFVEDVLFFSAAAGATLWFSIRYCSGWLRLFVLFGECLGFLLYHFTVGEIVIRCLGLIWRAVQGVFAWIWRRILKPLAHAVLYIPHIIIKNVVLNLQKSKKPSLFHKFFLKQRARMMYNKNNHQAD